MLVKMINGSLRDVAGEPLEATVLVKMINGSLRDVAGEPLTGLVALTKCSNKWLKLTQ